MRGEPSDEEFAALIAVLAGLAVGTAPQAPATRSSWADPARQLRTSLRPGPGAWRVSLRDHRSCPHER